MLNISDKNDFVKNPLFCSEEKIKGYYSKKKNLYLQRPKNTQTKSKSTLHFYIPNQTRNDVQNHCKVKNEKHLTLLLEVANFIHYAHFLRSK